MALATLPFYKRHLEWVQRWRVSGEEMVKNWPRLPVCRPRIMCLFYFFFQQEWEISIGGAMMIVQSTTCMYFYWSQWSRGHGTVCPSITGPHWRHVRLAWSSYITQNHNLNIFWRFPVNPITWWETNRKNKTLCQTAALFTVRQEHCPLYQCVAL